MKCSICNEELGVKEPVKIDGQIVCHKAECIDEAVKRTFAPVKRALRVINE